MSFRENINYFYLCFNTCFTSLRFCKLPYVDVDAWVVLRQKLAARLPSVCTNLRTPPRTRVSWAWTKRIRKLGGWMVSYNFISFIVTCSVRRRVIKLLLSQKTTNEFLIKSCSQHICHLEVQYKPRNVAVFCFN